MDFRLQATSWQRGWGWGWDSIPGLGIGGCFAFAGTGPGELASFHAGNRAGIEKQDRSPRFSTRPQIEQKDFPRQHIHQTQSVGEGRFWIWGRVCSAVGYSYLQDGGGVGNTLR